MLLQNLTIGYQNSAPIVSSIDAELLPTSFTCLLGRNGSGKSTLLMTLAGQLEPLSGAVITAHQQSVDQLQVGQQSKIHCSLVLPHMPSLQNTTVRELVSYGRLPYSNFFGRLSEADYKAADEAIALVGITGLADRYTHLLSDGERQKALIARGLAQGSNTLLLDEPSAFLDYPSRRQLMQLLQRLAHDEGKTILLSTHDVELAADYADLLWIIHEQQLIKKVPQDFHPKEL